MSLPPILNSLSKAFIQGLTAMYMQNLISKGQQSDGVAMLVLCTTMVKSIVDDINPDLLGITGNTLKFILNSDVVASGILLSGPFAAAGALASNLYPGINPGVGSWQQLNVALIKKGLAGALLFSEISMHKIIDFACEYNAKQPTTISNELTTNLVLNVYKTGTFVIEGFALAMTQTLGGNMFGRMCASAIGFTMRDVTSPFVKKMIGERFFDPKTTEVPKFSYEQAMISAIAGAFNGAAYGKVFTKEDWLNKLFIKYSGDGSVSEYIIWYGAIEGFTGDQVKNATSKALTYAKNIIYYQNDTNTKLVSINNNNTINDTFTSINNNTINDTFVSINDTITHTDL